MWPQSGITVHPKFTLRINKLCDQQCCKNTGSHFGSSVGALAGDWLMGGSHEKEGCKLTEGAALFPCAIHGAIGMHLQVPAVLTIQMGNDALQLRLCEHTHTHTHTFKTNSRRRDLCI